MGTSIATACHTQYNNPQYLEEQHLLHLYCWLKWPSWQDPAIHHTLPSVSQPLRLASYNCAYYCRLTGKNRWR